MEILKNILLVYLRWSGWLATASFFYYAKRSWEEGTKKDFFSIVGCGVGGVLLAAGLLAFCCWYGRIPSLIGAIAITVWAGNIFWIFGIIICMSALEKGIEFVDFYHDWRDSLNGPSD